MKYILIAIIIIIILIAALGAFLARFLLRIPAQTLEGARAWQEERYDLSWYDVIDKQSYTVKSYDGYELHTQLLINPKPSRDYVVITHGYTDNRFGAMKYARIYLDLGFNVLVYDVRGHGENEPTFCSYTVRERKDLREIIKDTRKRHPDAERFGIHGESLGAATSVAVLNYQPEIDFVVADCPFTSFKRIMKEVIKAYHLPGGVIELAGFFAKIMYKVDFNDMSPIDCLAQNPIPVMYIHGQEDRLISPMNSADLYDRTEGLRELRFIPGAAHAESVLKETEAYRQYVTEFLEKVYE